MLPMSSARSGHGEKTAVGLREWWPCPGAKASSPTDQINLWSSHHTDSPGEFFHPETSPEISPSNQGNSWDAEAERGAQTSQSGKYKFKLRILRSRQLSRVKTSHTLYTPSSSGPASVPSVKKDREVLSMKSSD